MRILISRMIQDKSLFLGTEVMNLITILSKYYANCEIIIKKLPLFKEKKSLYQAPSLVLLSTSIPAIACVAFALCFSIR